MKLVKISQVLFGTDFPYNNATAHIEGLAQCGFTPDEMKAIYHDNAARLLPRVRVG
jgi:predicted TIM-barrel fold metal-dependent hydrolase